MTRREEGARQLFDVGENSFAMVLGVDVGDGELSSETMEQTSLVPGMFSSLCTSFCALSLSAAASSFFCLFFLSFWDLGSLC